MTGTGLDRRHLLALLAAAFVPAAARAAENPADFVKLTAEEFAAAIATGPASEPFRQRFARFDPSSYDGWHGPDFKIHRGDLSIAGNWRAPGFQTLVVGNLTVDGFVDLANPHDEGFDEGGLFIVLGSLRCHAFANEYGKVAMVDGDLVVRDIILNDYEDSALTVSGNLRTRYFRGQDIWAEVGGSAEMAYGEGYCLPLGYTDAAAQAIRPRHSETESRAILSKALNPQADTLTRDMVALLRQGIAVLQPE
jgi:hypothetical protein